MNKRFAPIINSINVAGMFAVWQGSIQAGCFALAVCAFVMCAIDYIKGGQHD